MLSPLPSIILILGTTLTDSQRLSLRNSKLSLNEKTKKKKQKTQWLVKANITKQVDPVVQAP